MTDMAAQRDKSNRYKLIEGEEGCITQPLPT
jgi:hypothetical protein